jgi:hypothetical protein
MITANGLMWMLVIDAVFSLAVYGALRAVGFGD